MTLNIQQPMQSQKKAVPVSPLLSAGKRGSLAPVAACCQLHNQGQRQQ